MSIAQPVSTAPRPRSPILRLSHLINPLVLRFAGTRLMPLYGVLTHRGRRSGKLFHTPVVVRPFDGGFIVPMPWGEGTDWYRNVSAAGEAVIRWKGRDYRVGRPELVDATQPSADFDAFQRQAMQRFGIRQAVRLFSLA